MMPPGPQRRKPEPVVPGAVRRLAVAKQAKSSRRLPGNRGCAGAGLREGRAAQAQKHVTVNQALDVLDCLTQLAVRSRGLNEPPTGAEEGERYLVAADAGGDWSGHDGKVVIFQAGQWVVHAPQPGWRVWIEDEGQLFIHDGEDWMPLPPPAALPQVELLGVGTAADAVNPLAVKANKALFTAKAVAEGGDGDFRYTINKEASGNTLSLLLQSGYSGRAELGLVGSDDISLKVSADGSNWLEALVVDRASGLVTFKQGFTGAHGLSRQSVTSSAGAVSIDYRLGQHVELLLDESVTSLTVGNWPASGGQILLVVKQDGTGGHGLAWPSAWLAPGGSKPVITTAPYSCDRYLVTHDGSTTVIDTLGQDYG